MGRRGCGDELPSGCLVIWSTVWPGNYNAFRRCAGNRLDPSATKSLRVLPMEDNEDDAQLLLRKLQGAGYAVLCERVDMAPGMPAALDQKRRDLIVTDYVMAHVSGLAALAEW